MQPMARLYFLLVSFGLGFVVCSTTIAGEALATVGPGRSSVGKIGENEALGSGTNHWGGNGLSSVSMMSLGVQEPEGEPGGNRRDERSKTVKVDYFAWSGALLAWYKLLIIAVVYIIWVKLADGVNQYLLKWVEPLEMRPEFWNIAMVGGFLFGLLTILLVPIFWIGLPFFLAGSFTPYFIFRSVRQGRLKASASVAFQVNPETANKDVPLPQDEGAEIDFTPPGDGDEQKRLGILARRSPAYVTLKNLIANMLVKRADLVLLDYSQQIVNARLQVDGAWHPLPPLERVEGDDLLTSLKYLAGLNPADRRNRQVGLFRCKYYAMDLKTTIEVTAQGIPTGERVQIKVLRATGKDQTLAQLGMWPESVNKVISAMNHEGLVIISAPLRNGFSTTWRSSLLAMDRYTRDCTAILEAHDNESGVENLIVHRFEENSSPVSVFKKVMLTQPQVLVVPNPANAEMMDLLTAEVVSDQRTVISRIHAITAAEALVRFLSLAKNKKQFVQAVTLVTSQRLFRTLCDHCKQPVAVNPDFVKRLGGDPSQTQTIFVPYVPPPNPVDEKGQPIEIPPCPKCSGYGYHGRSAIFEILVVNDAIRKTLMTTPQVQAVADISRKSGNLDQMQEAYRLVLAGVTSIDEVKRVFQTK